MPSTRTRSAIKTAKSESWARSGQKDSECLDLSWGPLSYSQGNVGAVFIVGPDLFYFDSG